MYVLFGISQICSFFTERGRWTLQNEPPISDILINRQEAGTLRSVRLTNAHKISKYYVSYSYIKFSSTSILSSCTFTTKISVQEEGYCISLNVCTLGERKPTMIFGHFSRSFVNFKERKLGSNNQVISRFITCENFHC